MAGGSFTTVAISALTTGNAQLNGVTGRDNHVSVFASNGFIEHFDGTVWEENSSVYDNWYVGAARRSTAACGSPAART